MAIPASRIVQITPRVVQAAGSDLALNGCFLTASRLVPIGRMLGFPNADAVGAKFGYASDEYKAASVYFAGYEGAFKRPRVVWFGSRAGATVTARLVGGGLGAGSLASVKSHASPAVPGRLALVINGMSIDVKGIDFSGILGEKDAAIPHSTEEAFELIAARISLMLSDRLHGVKCSYVTEDESGEPLENARLEIVAPPTPSGSSITVAVQTPLSTDLCLSAVGGAQAVPEELVPGAPSCAVLKGAQVTASLDDFREETNGTLHMSIDGADVNVSGVDLSGKGSAYLYGGRLQSEYLAALQKVEDGSFTLKVNGVPVSAKNVNLTGQAVLWGGTLANAAAEAAKLTQLKTFSAGTLSMTINGTEVALTGINLSAAPNLVNAAVIVENALAAAVSGTRFVYDGTARRFVMHAPAKPDSASDKTSAIVLPESSSGSLADALLITAEEGARTNPSAGRPSMFYYAAVNNIKPVLADDCARPSLLGGAFSAQTDDILAQLKVITTGDFSLKINDVTVSISSVNLSLDAVATLDDVAAAVQAKLQAELDGVECLWDGGGRRFIIRGPNANPETNAITAASDTTLAQAMALRAADGAMQAATKGTDFSYSDFNVRFEIAAPVPTTAGVDSVIELAESGGETALSTLLRISAAAGADAVPAQYLVQSFSDVAARVGAEISSRKTGAVCAYSSLTKSFWVYSPTSGAASTITLADVPGSAAGTSVLPVLMGLCGPVDGDPGTSGGSAEQGMDAVTVAENFASLKGSSENWALFTTVYKASDDEHLALAGWAAAQGVEYLYVAWSTDEALKQAEESTSIAAKFKAADADATALVFGDLQYAAFILGIPASIDWDRSQGVVTAAFKAQGGLGPVIDNAGEAEVLLSKRCNLYGTYASRNDSFVWLYDGSCYGPYRYMDAFWNTIWLASAIQTACMQGFRQTPRVPYNEDGFSLVRSWIQDPINRGVKNGCIDAGLSLSEAQKAQFLRETSLDDQALSVLENDGYFLMVRDAGPQTRPNRDSPEVICYYTYAGSVHRLEIPATMFV